MKCTNCGTRVDRDQKFCASCGSEVEFVFEEAGNTRVNQNNFDDMNIESLLNFDRMITPSIIKILFLVGVAAAAIFSIAMAISIGGFGGILLGVFIFLALSIASRVNCEIIIVVFKIYESLIMIREK